MELDSAYAGMQGPTATMDIKIGKKTWEDDASPAKVAKESKKFDEVYSQSSAMDGFRVAGMKAGELVLNSSNLKARFSLLTEEFGSWLLPAFFACSPGYGELPEGSGKCQPDPRGCEIDMLTAADVLETLRAICAAAEMGFGGTLRASSLLFTREMRMGGKCTVHLIDFAHYSPSIQCKQWTRCKFLWWSPELSSRMAKMVSTKSKVVYLLWSTQVIACRYIFPSVGTSDGAGGRERYLPNLSKYRSHYSPQKKG